MYTIGDLVKLDEHITEQSVVQIDFYTEQVRNLTLLRNFVFTRSAPEGGSGAPQLSNLQILNRLREACISDAKENIFCVIANYGHGKSHFGLVLANYFGRSIDSLEFRTVMDKIAHAEGDEQRVRNLLEFREQREPFLVVRLRGDSPLSLDQQFLQAVERALKEAGIDGHLPLWYHAAAKWLQEDLSELGFEQRAAQYLRKYSLDLPTLIKRVLEYDEQTHHIVNDLFKHLTGAPPQFAALYQIGEVLERVLTHYGERFGGVLILFDEFSLFVQNYSRVRTHAGALQHLLETVDKLRQRVLFVAFAQHDPEQVARDVAANSSLQGEVLKELQRLPKSNKVLLFTNLERVIDAYLKQDDNVFSQFLNENSQFDDHLWEAGSLARKALSHRYADEQWTSEQFHEIVSKGCFPLHPLTTAILCEGKLAQAVQTSTPRSVLGFVVEQVRNCQQQPVVTEDRSNWIYPVALVDYFYPMLSELHRQQYELALQRIAGQPAPEERAVLKAILLLTATSIPTQPSDFVEMVAHLSGVKEHRVREILRRLVEQHVLYEEMGRYRFFSLGGDPARLRDLREHVFALHNTQEDLEGWDAEGSRQEVNVSWGHRDDWGAREVIWLSSAFTAERLLKEAPLVRLSSHGLHDPGARGLVIRLVALSEDECHGLAERVAQVLDEAFPDENAPAVLVVLPETPMPELPKWTRWHRYLHTEIKPGDRQQIGEELLRQERAQVQKLLDQAKNRLLSDRAVRSDGSSNIVVSKAYRAGLQAKSPQKVEDALKNLYSLAYRYAPSFFTQYHHNSSKLRADVVQVCKKLADNGVAQIVSTFGNRPGRDCIHQYLQDRWRILASDYSIQKPVSSPNLKQAWELLDNAFLNKDTAHPVGDVLLRLMNPPFGYHYHPLALLFSAWYGYHRERIEFTINGKLDNLLTIWEYKGVDRSEKFIQQLVYVHQVAIKQRDLDQEQSRFQQIVDKVLARQDYFSQQEAEQALAILNAPPPELTDRLLEDAQNAIRRLEEDIETANSYDKRAQQLLNMAQSENSLRLLAETYVKPGLPDLGIVLPEQPSEQELRERLLQRFKERVEMVCREAERLHRLEDVSKFTEGLQAIMPYVRQTGRQELEQRVKEAQKAVQQRAEELRRQAADKELLGELRAIDPNALLATLRQYGERLREMEPQAQSTQELLRSKQHEIQQAIQSSEQRLNNWRARFEQATEPSLLRQLQEEMLGFRQHYQGSSEQGVLNDLLDRTNTLLNLLEQIKNELRALPDSRHGVQELMQRIQEVARRNEHPVVQQQVQEAETQINQHVREREEKARQWLAERESQVQARQNLSELLHQLQQPPAFLPESETARLESLRGTVRQLLEEDAYESVRQRLREISDREKLLQLRDEIERRLKELPS